MQMPNQPVKLQTKTLKQRIKRNLLKPASLTFHSTRLLTIYSLMILMEMGTRISRSHHITTVTPKFFCNELHVNSQPVLVSMQSAFIQVNSYRCLEPNSVAI